MVFWDYLVKQRIVIFIETVFEEALSEWFFNVVDVK